MEGTTPITLRRYEITGQDGSGQEMRGLVQSIPVLATRADRGGLEREQAGTQIGNWRTRFVVRRDGLEALDEVSWDIIDELGREYDIEAVAESPIGHRRWWWLYCTRRETQA